MSDIFVQVEGQISALESFLGVVGLGGCVVGATVGGAGIGWTLAIFSICFGEDSELAEEGMFDGLGGKRRHGPNLADRIWSYPDVTHAHARHAP